MIPSRKDKPMQPYDVAIIGGSFAGLSAALYLARARRRVVLFDHGITRNRFAHSAHAFLGQDGRTPDAIRMAGRADVLAYPTVTLTEARVDTLVRTETGFLLDNETHATRVILAHGMRDMLPDIPGLADGWGQSVMQCPYCHGYERADQPAGVLMTGPGALHHAAMLPDWTDDLAFFANGHALTEADRRSITDRGTSIHDAPVARIHTHAGQRADVELTDGSLILRTTLYTVSQQEPSCDLPMQIGCHMTQGPNGPHVTVDALQQTSQPGVFAAGDLCRPMYGAVFAAADGARAGISVHAATLVPLPAFAP
jgi:thioredoxin reductase